MSILFIDGFDWVDSADIADLAQLWTLSEIAMLVGTGRAGGAEGSVQFVTANNVDFFERPFQVVDDDNDTHYLGFAIKLDALPASIMNLIDFRAASDVVGCSVRIGTGGELTYYRGTGTGEAKVTHPNTLSAGVWHYIEIAVSFDSTVSSGRLELGIDGVYTPLNTDRNILGDPISKLRFFKDVALPVLDIDDFYYKYLATPPSPLDSGFLGDSRVTMIVPTGVVGGVDNWALGAGANKTAAVDEAIGVPHDGAAGFITETTPGDEERYDMGSPSLDAGATIHAVAVNVVGDQDGLDVTTVVDAASSTPEDGSAPIGLASGAYNHKQHIHEDYNSLPWTVSDVNALDVGVKAT